MLVAVFSYRDQHLVNFTATFQSVMMTKRNWCSEGGADVGVCRLDFVMSIGVDPTDPPRGTGIVNDPWARSL